MTEDTAQVCNTCLVKSDSAMEAQRSSVWGLGQGFENTSPSVK